jgi:hypothetical protein
MTPEEEIESRRERGLPMPKDLYEQVGDCND